MLIAEPRVVPFTVSVTDIFTQFLLVCTAVVAVCAHYQFRSTRRLFTSRHVLARRKNPSSSGDRTR